MNVIFGDDKFLNLEDKFFYKEFLKKRKCAFCKIEYTLKNSFGKLQCSFHPCDYDDRKKKRACCGRGLESKFCRACDHNDKYYFDKDIVDIDSKYFYAEGKEEEFIVLPQKYGGYSVEEENKTVFQITVVDKDKFINN